jgi:hypothetical protein
MAIMKAFFDETGTHKASPITGIGGFVGSAKSWSVLEPKWQSVLNEFKDKGVDWFHMSEAAARTGQFKLIDAPGIDYLIGQLARHLGEQDLTAFFSAVLTDHWAVIQDPQFLARFPTALDLCFENLVQHLWKWGAANAVGEKIVPMFAYSREFSQRQGKLLDLYGVHDWYRQVLGPIAFGYPQDVIPLQAADLLAHQMNWDAEKRFKPITLATIGPTPALEWATNGKFVRGNLLEKSGLLSIEKRFRDAGYPSGPVDLF